MILLYPFKIIDIFIEINIKMSIWGLYNKVMFMNWECLIPKKIASLLSFFLNSFIKRFNVIQSFAFLPVFFLLLILQSANGQGHAQEMIFTNLTTAMGLSHGDITCLHQDYEGYIWIGTKDGLNKYDGINFTVYRSIKEDTTTLSNSQINYIYEDKHQNLWIGVGNGLCRYNRELNHFERINYLDDHNNTLEDHGIAAIYQDTTGRLWLGSINNGLYWVDPIHRRFHNIFETDIPAKTVTQISQDPNGMLWFSFRGGENKEGGLIKYDLKTKKITIYDHKHPAFKQYDVYAFEFDKEGNLYAGTHKGLIVFNEKKMTWAHYSENLNEREGLNNHLILSIVKTEE